MRRAADSCRGCNAGRGVPPRAALLVKLCLVAATACAAENGVKDVQFVVIVPDAAETQAETIFVCTSVDGWAEPGRPLRRIAPSVYVATLEFPAKAQVSYKFTRAGSWASVEKSRNGHELPNRALTIDERLREHVAVHIVRRWADRPLPEDCAVDVSPPGRSPAEPPQAHTLTGDIRYHHVFPSPELRNARTIMVYLPPGYDAEPTRRYPVLYLHDGNNVFDARTSFTGAEWRADETAQRLIEAGRIPPLIMVGIYNNAQRHEEYTPFADAERGGGRGDQYLKFVAETLKPFIDRTYRTRPGREDTALAGSSLGGLISLYALYRYPEVFGKAGVLSPALWWADDAMLEFVRKHTLKPPQRIWIDTGTAEGHVRADGVSAYVQGARDLARVLGEQGLKRGRDFTYEEVDGGQHHERDWAARFDRLLIYLFGGSEQN